MDSDVSRYARLVDPPALGLPLGYATGLSGRASTPPRVNIPYPSWEYTDRHLNFTCFFGVPGRNLPVAWPRQGGDFWPPLAVVLIGGVGGSTLLALLFTPVLHRRFASPSSSV